jgi:methyl-accepting chemotaxis protein
MKSNDPSVAEDHSTNRARNGRRRSDGHRPPLEREPSDAQLGDLLAALSAAANGDFSVRVTVDGYSGVMRQVAQKFNRMAELNEALTDEITRVERVVRREGRMTETASLRGVTGGWSQIVSSVNSLISGLVQPSTEVARVISAVAHGDLTQKMAMELDGQPVKGEFLRIGRTVNAMVDQLSSFAAEVTRVARRHRRIAGEKFQAVGSGERTWLRGRAISRSARDNHDGSATPRPDTAQPAGQCVQVHRKRFGHPQNNPRRGYRSRGRNARGRDGSDSFFRRRHRHRYRS